MPEDKRIPKVLMFKDREEFMKRIINVSKEAGLLAWRSIKQFSRDEEARFRLMTAFKITGITFVTFLMQLTILYGLLAIDLIFFQSQGYPGQAVFTETFYDFLLIGFLENTLYIGLSLLFVFVVGIYIGHLLLRPFRMIGDYCQNFVDKGQASYDPDFFTDLNVLARFSEYFFHLMENFYKNRQVQKIDIPHKFARIRGPVFERGFFLQYFLLIFMISIGTGSLLSAVNTALYDGMITLAEEVIPKTNQMRYFLTAQADIWNTGMYATMTIHFVLYFALSIHLYGRVSAPAFGMFATMRAFLKGAYSNRVHLIGYSYVRPQCRQFNKYLDFMQRELELEEAKKN
jgi:hypothetical protein